MAKAFNNVSRHLLIYKLNSIAIHYNILSWITSSLSNRKQCVQINSYYSKFHHAVSGVPQGYVIGPLLFLIYINNLPSIIKHHLSICLFANDSKISCRILYLVDII